MSLLNRRSLILTIIFSLLSSVTFMSASAQSQNQAAKPSPTEALRAARTIFIRSNSVFFKPSTLENSLLQQDEFQQWGMAITRNESDADLIIEVSRKAFTTSFIYSVIDSRNNRIVASGRVNSIGGTVEGKITDSFMKKLRAARQPSPSTQVKQPD